MSFLSLPRMQEFLGEIVGREEVRCPLKMPEGKARFLTTLAIRKEFSFDPGGGGGALGYFLGGYLPPGTPNLHPLLEKIYPKNYNPF